MTGPRRPWSLTRLVIESTASRFDFFCAACILVLGLCLFGANSSLLGFYADDAGFLKEFKDMTLAHAIAEVGNYVPGRNLHMLWQYWIFACTSGPSLNALPAQHWIQSFFTSGNAALLFILLRRLSLPTSPSLLAAWLFLLGPTHGQVHFWQSALPMNLISTFFVLSLALAALGTVRAAARGENARAVALLVLDGVISVAGAFTYDQAVPLLSVIMLGVAVAASRARRAPHWISLLSGAFVLALLASLYYCKTHAPTGSGPSFSNITAAHISGTFVESFRYVYGDLFQRILFANTLPFSNAAIRTQAACLAVAILALGFLCVSRDLRARQVEPQPSPIRLFTMLLGSIAFFFLAYAPIYLWFISPRHTYLPSIGVACFVAILIGGALRATAAYLHARNCAAIARFVIFCLAAVTYFLAQSILVDKQSWAVSYQARKHMYDDLSQDRKFLSASLFVFESVPVLSPFGTAILGYQPATEPGLMTNGATKVRLMRPFSLQGPTGDFIFVELDEWGDSSFVHIPKDEIFRLRYQGLDRKRMRFRLTNNLLPASEPPISVEPIDDSAGGAGGDPLVHLVPIDASQLELIIPSTELSAGEVLAAVPLAEAHPGAAPLTGRLPDNRRYMFVIELPSAGAPGPWHFRLRLNPALPAVKGISIYAVNSTGRRSLGQAFLPK